MAEWSIASVLKTEGPQGPVGSNPTPSATCLPDDLVAAHRPPGACGGRAWRATSPAMPPIPAFSRFPLPLRAGIRTGTLLCGAVLCAALLACRSPVVAAGGAGAAPAGTAAAPVAYEEPYAALLRKYVTDDGVRYAAWKANAADLAALRSVVDAIAKAPASTGADAGQLAFYINAYNAWILHEKLAEYPKNRDQRGLPILFFTTKRITVAGEKMSFNRLEKDIIRTRFDEPRIHFALNCASVSCPPLAAEPYVAAKLSVQFDAIARRFLNSSNGVRVPDGGRKVQVSKIFDWYKEDFAKAGGTVAVVNRYRKEKIPADAAIDFLDYNWALNEAK